ncbi:MAG: hypothetical protein AAFR27_14075, partial [Pseudomonadota bacterium]
MIENDQQVLEFAQREMLDGTNVVIAIVTASRRPGLDAGTMAAVCEDGRECGWSRAFKRADKLVPDVLETGNPKEVDSDQARFLLVRVG